MSEAAGARLKGERERLGFSQKAFGELVGVSKNTQGAYENGSSPITLDYLDRLAEHGVDTVYVMLGTPPVPQSHELIPQDDVEIDSIDFAYGLGGTFADIEEGSIEIEKAKFSRNWLRRFTHSPPEVLFTTSGVGDSMKPLIDDHDILIIDRSIGLRDALGDKIWAIVFGGVGMIKRLRPMPDGTVKIISANTDVPIEVATDGDLHVVGRVVAKVSRL